MILTNMQLPLIARTFLSSAENWLCDRYHVTVRYLAYQKDGRFFLMDASIQAYPRAPEEVDPFEIVAGDLLGGQQVHVGITRSEALKLFSRAASGEIVIGTRHLALEGDQRHFHSEMNDRERWFSDLHLLISGQTVVPLETATAVLEDAMLRRGKRPFDGISDLAIWLGLTDRRGTSQSAAITLRISPPVDLDFTASKVEAGSLEVQLIAHHRVNTKLVEVAIRTLPGASNMRRFQAKKLVHWTRPRDGWKRGSFTIQLANLESALVMPSLGALTVRRQWLLDPVKAANQRLTATRQFDRELKQLRNRVLDSADSSKFESGISALLFLMGFAASVQLETDAPDIIAATPEGALMLVECTLRAADVNAKVGKLVDRKQALVRTLNADGRRASVDAFLVTSQSRDQLASDARTLAQHGVTLISREDLVEVFNRVWFPGKPDDLLATARARLAALVSPIE